MIKHRTFEYSLILHILLLNIHFLLRRIAFTLISVNCIFELIMILLLLIKGIVSRDSEQLL